MPKKSIYPFDIPRGQQVECTLLSSNKTLVGVITCNKDKSKWTLNKIVNNSLIKMKSGNSPKEFSTYFFKNYKKKGVINESD